MRYKYINNRIFINNKRIVIIILKYFSINNYNRDFSLLIIAFSKKKIRLKRINLKQKL